MIVEPYPPKDGREAGTESWAGAMRAMLQQMSYTDVRLLDGDLPACSACRLYLELSGTFCRHV